MPTAMTQGTPAPDQVTIILDKTQYGKGDVLSVTIYNRVATPITASDHQSACTVVTVQIERNGTWANVGKCLQGAPTRQITMDANSTKTVTVSPGASNLSLEATWLPGTYRVVFTYIPGKAETVGAATVVNSVPFTVS